MGKKREYFLVYILAGLLLAGAFANEGWAANSMVILQTNYGDIVLKLYDEEAPVTVENFLGYVNRDFYTGLIFHRVANLSTTEDSYIIQAGAYDENLYDPNLSGDDPNYYFADPNWIQDERFYHEPNDPIENESDNGLSNLRGTIAMARGRDDVDSATSQFYINVDDNTSLDPLEYCVFGQVVRGMEVADAIAAVEVVTIGTGKLAMEDVPAEEAAVVISEAEQYVMSFEQVWARGSGYRQSPSDSIAGTGTMDAVEADLMGSDYVTVRIGPADANMINEESIEVGEFSRARHKARYVYRNNRGTMVKLLKLDFEDHRFTVAAQELDLSGTDEALALELEFGDYYGRAEADDAVVNGGKGLPLEYIWGIADGLQVERFVLVYDNRSGTMRRLLLKGGLTTKEDEVDLMGQQVTVQWGTSIFTIPEGVENLQRIRNKYFYHNSGASGVTAAVFDLDRKNFVIRLKSTSLSVPSSETGQTFGLSFQTDPSDPNIVFDESVSVRVR